MPKSEPMRIVVTDHAVTQYRNKLLQWYCRDGPNDELKEKLKTIVRYDKKGAILPGNLIEYKKAGMAVATRYKGNDIIIITFLGDKEWRGWWQRKERWITKSRKAVCAL